MYPDMSSRSAQLYEEAVSVLPGGNNRITLHAAPYPIYARSGQGARITDVDGVERLDFLNGYTVLIHGYGHKPTMQAIMQQVQLGTCFPFPTETEIRLAELLCARVPSMERVRFVNSGSEAVIMAMKATRAYTGRPKIAKCEGCFHGIGDFAEISLEPGALSAETGWPTARPYVTGSPDGIAGNMVILPFNDTVRAEQILTAHAHEVAAVLLDPLPSRAGLIPANPDFLKMLRTVTRKHGIVLICDEVMSFRLGYHGAQGEFGIEPDLTTMAKIIGGGVPLGAIGGRAEIMSVFDPRHGKPSVPHAGTFNAWPVAMAAGAATLTDLTPEAFVRLNALGDRLRSSMSKAFREAGVPGQVMGKGSLARIVMVDQPIEGYRDTIENQAQSERLNGLHRYMLNHGIIMGSWGLVALSTPMGEAEVDQLVETLFEGLLALKA